MGPSKCPYMGVRDGEGKREGMEGHGASEARLWGPQQVPRGLSIQP